jgi:hypothetical protein
MRAFGTSLAEGTWLYLAAENQAPIPCHMVLFKVGLQEQQCRKLTNLHKYVYRRVKERC